MFILEIESVCSNCGTVHPVWLLYLCIAFGILFLVMLVINLFLCTAMSCSCTKVWYLVNEERANLVFFLYLFNSLSYSLSHSYSPFSLSSSFVNVYNDVYIFLCLIETSLIITKSPMSYLRDLPSPQIILRIISANLLATFACYNQGYIIKNGLRIEKRNNVNSIQIRTHIKIVG